jgi:hypothetical protein
MFQNLWPSLLAVFEEEACIEFDAADDLEFGSLTMLVADLCGNISRTLGIISSPSQHSGGPGCFSLMTMLEGKR